MSPPRNEHTIAASCEVSGRGYWSGQEVRVQMHPAPAGTGIRLARRDLPGTPECGASIRHVRDTPFRTNLECGAARFAMVEHVMAALTALEIDNCRVEIDGEEFPGLDGSSQPYVEALRHAGLIVQAATRRRIVIAEPLRVEQDGRWIEALPSADGAAHYEYRLRYEDDTPIAEQRFGCRLTPRGFVREVAAARTFVTESQAAELHRRGVARHVGYGDLLVFGPSGPIDNRLRYPEECARHKVLDLIGDLSLVNADLIGRVVSFRGGHVLNAMLARQLVARCRVRRAAEAPHPQARSAA